ncbi:hypothetical protein HPB50_027731 [Hyalomma asiaticum]|nr:hypothetical protein HPB50_027731 [Hyalomma asiaticum]
MGTLISTPPSRWRRKKALRTKPSAHSRNLVTTCVTGGDPAHTAAFEMFHAEQRRRSRKTAGKEQHQRSTKVSSARNAAAPPQHHDDARSLRNPPAWTSRLQPNLQAAARTCPPGQAKEEASPAGSEEPRPNEAARVMMQKTARDQGFANWLLQEDMAWDASCLLLLEDE